MNADILVFGEDWGSHPSSTQHLFKHLCRNRKVLWVNSIGLRRPKINLKDMQRVLQKAGTLLGRKAKKKQENQYFNVISPKAVPWPGNRAAKWLNQRVLTRQIQNQMEKIGMKNPILWTSLPTAADILGHFGEQRIIYYCGDDFSALEGVDHAPVTKCERELASRADIILAASEKLLQKFPSGKSYYLPHGVDFKAFSTPARFPSECRSHRPKAGFYGSLAEWIDIELIAKTAIKRPDWDFFLIGPVKTDISALKNMPNVKILPPQAHETLPSFVQSWDAALLPFKNTEQIQSCNPLKLREYLASGTPIISTDFPALAPYRDVISIIKNVDDFVTSLDAVLKNPRPAKVQRDRVEQESWQSRAAFVDQLLRNRDR